MRVWGVLVGDWRWLVRRGGEFERTLEEERLLRGSFGSIVSRARAGEMW